MTQIISDLLASYEHGMLSRRQLVQGLAALAAGGYAVPASGSTFQGMGLNHIAIRVSNVQRSRDFYEKVFGLPLIRESESSCFLGLGKNFLTLFQNQTPGEVGLSSVPAHEAIPIVLQSTDRPAGCGPRTIPASHDRAIAPTASAAYWEEEVRFPSGFLQWSGP